MKGEPKMTNYFSYQTTLEESKYLRPLDGLVDAQDIEIFHLKGIGKPDRKMMNGSFTVKAKIEGKKIGIIYNDFRVYGGSFSQENSQRICAFLKEMERTKTPVIFMLNSIGVRIMEGRGVFPYAFKIVPALRNFVKSNLLITTTMGRCLGLGALLFACGDYRLSLREETKLNLTGPEVFKLFFGDAANFDEISSSERQFEQTDLINEICDDKEALNVKIRDIVSGKNADENIKLSENEAKLLNKSTDSLIEVYPKYNQSVRTFIATKNGHRFGIFLNPPGKANMLNVDCIDRFNLAINLFEKLHLPVISLVDTPGADPRIEQNDENIISKLTNMAIKIVDYPYAKKGMIYGRCYGGASVFSFPSVFGGEPSVALEGANVGIMSNKIIDQLLSGSPRFHAEWKENSAKETECLQDFIDAGVLDKRITESELSEEINTFLNKATLRTNFVQGLAPKVGEEVSAKDMTHYGEVTNLKMNTNTKFSL
jgi:acetyl-CoA carboxylase carboxyltransferase component